jgi:hypothetical protein
LIEHLTQNEVGDYCRRQLCPAALLKVADHIGACEFCRQKIENELSSDTAFFALRAEVFGDAEETSPMTLARLHATAEQTAGYVDGTLAGEELQMVADHLSRCELCAAAVDDVGAFRYWIKSSLDREYQPAIAPASMWGWWNGSVASLAAFVPRPARLAVGSAFAIVLLAVTSWLVWQTLPVEPKQESASSPTPPSQPDASPAARLVAQVYDGGAKLTLDETGKLEGADDLPPAYQLMLKKALISQRIGESPRLTGLTRGYSPLMSAEKREADFGLIAPVGKMLFSDRPTFRWSPLKGATGYLVEVYDSAFNLVARSPELTNPSWAAPSLPRGTLYTWQVRAIKDGQEIRSPRPPAPQARFRVVDQVKANELLNARRAYSSHLALGLLYAEAGLLEEAERELRALKIANPESEIIRRLLGQIQAMKGKYRTYSTY